MQQDADMSAAFPLRTLPREPDPPMRLINGLPYDPPTDRYLLNRPEAIRAVRAGERVVADKTLTPASAQVPPRC